MNFELLYGKGLTNDVYDREENIYTTKSGEIYKIPHNQISKKQWALSVVVTNWRIRARLPRLTQLAIKLNLIDF